MVDNIHEATKLLYQDENRSGQTLLTTSRQSSDPGPQTTVPVIMSKGSNETALTVYSTKCMYFNAGISGDMHCP